MRSTWQAGLGRTGQRALVKQLVLLERLRGWIKDRLQAWTRRATFLARG